MDIQNIRTKIASAILATAKGDDVSASAREIASRYSEEDVRGAFRSDLDLKASHPLRDAIYPVFKIILFFYENPAHIGRHPIHEFLMAAAEEVQTAKSQWAYTLHQRAISDPALSGIGQAGGFFDKNNAPIFALCGVPALAGRQSVLETILSHAARRRNGPKEKGGGLAVLPSLTAIVKAREEAIAAYHEMKEAAARSVKAAQEASGGNSYVFSSGRYHGSMEAPRWEDFRADLDRAIWRHVVQLSKISALMGAKEKEDFHKSLEKSVPEATLENLNATLQTLQGDRAEIFRRSIVHLWQQLPRSYKTNAKSGFKIGKKIIFERAFSEWGGWNHYARAGDFIDDLERARGVYEGEDSESGYSFLRSMAEKMARVGDEMETAHYKLRAFQNGNLHLTFKDEVLVARLNETLSAALGYAIEA